MADEFDIIRTYFAPLAGEGALGLGDDAALITERTGFETVITTDAIVAGVHYLADDGPARAADKLCGSNLSDLAAMGADPVGFTLDCAWPEAVAEADIAAFATALKPWVEDFRFPLLGGDTVVTPGPAMFVITAFGRVKAGQALRRSGARPGDTVFVTGTIGDGALGLLAASGALGGLDKAAQEFLSRRYRHPEPRVAAGRALIGHAGAAIDISDGLVQDLGHIARASDVGIEIDAVTVPLSDAAAQALAANTGFLAAILTGGDDYELAFTAKTPPPDLGVPTTAIGRVTGAPGSVRMLDAAGDEIALDSAGYRHFPLHRESCPR